LVCNPVAQAPSPAIVHLDADYIKREIAKWAKLVKETGAKLD